MSFPDVTEPASPYRPEPRARAVSPSEVDVSGKLVADLGVGPEIWLFLTLLGGVTLFFKFSRIWSVRNLDLLLLFALAPGMMVLVGTGSHRSWIAYLWLFFGSTLWLARCLIDLSLTRRPILEPNLNAAGLACLSIGVLGLLVAETISLPVDEGAARNPADPGERPAPPSASALGPDAADKEVLKIAPLPDSLRPNPPQVILSRVLASLAHLGLVATLLVVGWRHFERPMAGLAAASCYLLMPYTRIAVVDSGQLVPAALIIAAVSLYLRPTLAGAMIGLAAGWMPACLGLIPLWAGFYRGRGATRFAIVGIAVVVSCGWLAVALPDLAIWARALGARSLAEAGLLPQVEAPPSGSFWSGIDVNYRLPVLIAYLALVVFTTLWPAEKNLGELIALSAALLVASQFWYLDKGGTLVLLYLPLLLLMMFRPNLASKRPIPPTSPRTKDARRTLDPVP
ncbi:MAG TPA: glycosyltransferase family 87 protein [Isosphaeraceae bacterium]|nr:glycosyltransferase family 87 protein [Isosphaeraceae bacterium]